MPFPKLNNYRIDQAYISQSVADFDWYNRFDLKPYYDSSKPCIFIGMYRDEDVIALKNHNSIAVVKWTGYDSIMQTDFKPFKKTIIKNITIHHNVKKHLESNNVRCKIIKPYTMNENIYQGLTGKKVYAYCPKTSIDYHRADIIVKLKRKYDILVGKNKFTQSEWHSGKKYEIYNQCYIGMVLNNHAGGVATIHELASQGKYCISNVAKTPNCLSWSSIDDIINHLNNPIYLKPNPELAKQIDFYTFEPDWLYIDL